MSDDLHQSEHVQGRRVTVSAWGPDLEGLEMSALDEARQFFGPERRLEINPDYQATTYTNYEPERRYHANIIVREVSSPTNPD